MIDNVGAIILDGKKMLVAREKDKEWFFIPGGKSEGNESDEECLRREILEELCMTIKEIKYYKDFITDASGTPDKVRVKAYFCKINGMPKPSGEIAELKWIDRNFDKNKVGNILKIMIPEMIKDDLL